MKTVGGFFSDVTRCLSGAESAECPRALFFCTEFFWKGGVVVSFAKQTARISRVLSNMYGGEAGYQTTVYARYILPKT